MKKSSLYTRTGDKGLTSLVSGTRVHKSDLRIDIYGDLDELNSLVGFALAAENNEFDVVKKLLTDTDFHIRELTFVTKSRWILLMVWG